MKKTPFHLILVALAVSSCATARYYGGFMPEKVGQDMALVGPVSAIYYLDEKNHESFNDTLSTFSETLITNLIDEMGVPVSGRIELNDDEKEEAFAFLRYLSDQDDRRLDLFPIPGVLDEALEAQGYRYGLLLVARGMTRDAKGYAKDALKGALLGVATAILSMGTFVMYSTADPYSSEFLRCRPGLGNQQDGLLQPDGAAREASASPRPVRKQLNKLLKDFLREN
jgi:hypothetical protein